MFNLFGRKNKKNPDSEKTSGSPADETEAKPAEEPHKPEPLNERLSRSRAGFGARLKALFGLARQIDDDLLEEIETQLIMADVGVEATTRIIDTVSRQVKRKELKDATALYRRIRELMAEMLTPCEQPLVPEREDGPFVILVVGINGAGKTTTIGKLAHLWKAQGKKIMLAAGDTFRAAAVEQLKTWGQRNDVPVVAQDTGADSASVIYDALDSARARGVDILIADTAGRLHTQDNLMEELKKIKRVMQKLDPEAPNEVLLVLDGGTGQNAVSQARQFHEAMGLTGLVVTKLDGTAKGGVLFALAENLGVPIRFIGVGEGIADLRPFHAGEFVAALLPEAEDKSESG